MRVEGEREFAAPRQTVWQVLNDPSQMAKTMPGVESFDIQDDRHWRANVKIPLGLGGLKMSVDFEKTEEREPDSGRRRRGAQLTRARVVRAGARGPDGFDRRLLASDAQPRADLTSAKGIKRRKPWPARLNW